MECTGGDGMSDEQKYLAALASLVDREIELTLPALSTFMTISAAQMATRHPGFPPDVLPRVVEVVQLLIHAIAPDPESDLHQLAMMGWDPANDVKVQS